MDESNFKYYKQADNQPAVRFDVPGERVSLFATGAGRTTRVEVVPLESKRLDVLQSTLQAVPEGTLLPGVARLGTAIEEAIAGLNINVSAPAEDVGKEEPAVSEPVAEARPPEDPLLALETLAEGELPGEEEPKPPASNPIAEASNPGKVGEIVEEFIDPASHETIAVVKGAKDHTDREAVERVGAAHELEGPALDAAIKEAEKKEADEKSEQPEEAA